MSTNCWSLLREYVVVKNVPLKRVWSHRHDENVLWLLYEDLKHNLRECESSDTFRPAANMDKECVRA